jgi:protein transport protein SEC13
VKFLQPREKVTLMASSSSTFDTGHEDMIHDVQLNYYGRRMATASSDRTIKIWDLSLDPDKQPERTADLKGHEGPVWQVSWAHPKFGNYLASSSYDRRVVIWKEFNKNDWKIVYEYKHELSVNSVCWLHMNMV